MNKHRRSVAVVIPKYGLVGGAERFVSEMTERLALRENLDIHVFANQWVRRSDRITFHRVPIIRFPKFLTTSSFAFFAGRAIRRNRIDLIHAHDRIYEADLFTMHGAPHAFWVREVRNKSMSLYDRATISVERRLMTSRRCRFFMPVSQLAGQKVLEEYPVDGRKLRIIHPGIDLDRFDGPDRRRRREEVRRRFSIEPDTLTVLFVSMNFEIKGLDAVIAALGHLKRKSRPSRTVLLAVGKGNRRKYAAQAEACGIAGDVIFAGVERDNLESFYLASDLFIMLSRFDTFGITVLEAMAASLPVIVSSTVGAKDLVNEGINGYIVPEPGDAERVSGIVESLADDARRSAMGEAARRTAADHTWDRATERVAALYEEILRGEAFGPGRS